MLQYKLVIKERSRRSSISALHLSRTRSFARRRNQLPHSKIVNNLLRLLDSVFDAVDALAQRIVLEVEQEEASEELLDERLDLDSLVKILECNAVGRETAELVAEHGEGGEVLFDGDMEGVPILEIYRDYMAQGSER